MDGYQGHPEQGGYNLDNQQWEATALRLLQAGTGFYDQLISSRVPAAIAGEWLTALHTGIAWRDTGSVAWLMERAHLFTGQDGLGRIEFIWAMTKGTPEAVMQAQERNNQQFMGRYGSLLGEHKQSTLDGGAQLGNTNGRKGRQGGR